MTGVRTDDVASPHVLLVHGIWNARFWLAPFAQRMRAQGFKPELFGYDSVFGGPEIATRRLIERLRRDPVPALIGHSLGGLIILEALRQAPELAVRRVVCLGSPLRGSRVASAIAERKRPLSHALGRSCDLLRKGCPPWRGAAQIGVIAGNRARGVGHWFTDMSEASDGTVTVAETRLEGIADHCILPASHTGLVLSSVVAAQAAAFLREGRFSPMRPAETAPSAPIQ